MAGKKMGRNAPKPKFNTWKLSTPEYWMLLVVGALGIANLTPNVNLNPALAYTWPIIVSVIAIKKLMDR